jgi:hypothetical protein
MEQSAGTFFLGGTTRRGFLGVLGMGAERASDDFAITKSLNDGLLVVYTRGAPITYEYRVPEYHLTNECVRQLYRSGQCIA